jgi:arginine decarboxylase
MPWTTRQARDTYNIPHWSGGYFDVGAHGTLIARPDRDPDAPGIDLHALAAELRAAGLKLPVLVRFGDILHDRIDTLVNAFTAAMRAEAYTGRYTAVYPIKVNQQRHVVDRILAHGGKRVGLEAGSKPELMAVLALADADHGMVVCNGYKDSEYIRLALIGRALGHRIKPLLGVRVRLASIGAGKWQNTGGEKAKFGLSAGQVLAVTERLRAAGMLDCLQLLHFHLGSQIANIRDVQRGMRECARYYAELHALGAKLGVVDVGGGLGVDYEGTRSRSFCSMNYSIEEYAHNVVHALWEVCAEHGLPHPDIVTESGRAMTAHHAVLITNVIDIEQHPDGDGLTAPAADDPQVLQDLWETYRALDGRSALEAYHDAAYWLSQTHDMYIHGVLTLAQRAQAEQIYFAICRKLQPLLQSHSRSLREARDELNEKLADKYFLNFSLFQSMPDVWAIDQIFPVVPLHRLDQEPLARAVIEDLTCDSDGRIDHYVDPDGIETTLPLHPILPGEDYLIGIFLIGAYQEILGDMHNLFGDTDSVNVELNPDGSHRLLHLRPGDTVDAVLRYVNYDAGELLAGYQAKIANASLDAAQRKQFLEELEEGLRGYTYLED